MEKLIINFIGFIIGIIILFGFYFIEYKPGLQREYKRGLDACTIEIDTFYIKGKDSIIFRDTSFTATKNEPVVKSDSSIVTSFDTTFYSNKDVIKVHADVTIKASEYYSKIDSIASWFMNIEHKDVETIRIDTLTIYIPKYIETVVTENNWMLNFISYIGGVVSAVIVFLLAN